MHELLCALSTLLTFFTIPPPPLPIPSPFLPNQGVVKTVNLMTCDSSTSLLVLFHAFPNISIVPVMGSLKQYLWEHTRFQK